MPDRALEGLRVIEFCDELGSYCGRLLADLGADVIKVEPTHGGVERRTPPFLAGFDGNPDTSIAFWVHNTSKRSVVLDLETDEGQAYARELCLTADVILEDNPPGWMAQRGLGFTDFHRVKHSLVYCSITGFGQDGLHSNYAYTDIVGQAMGGIMTLAGEPVDPPNVLYGNQANVSASIQAAQGILLAVLHAEATGQGQLVDVSAQEALSMSQETAMQTWDLQKKNRARTGEKGMIPVSLPGLGVYECADGQVTLYILAPGGADFPALVDWMREEGKQEDLDDEPYKDIASQLSMGWLTQVMGDPSKAAPVFPALMHMQEVLRRFFAQKPAREAYKEGQFRRLLVGLVSTPKDIAENEQLRAREWFTHLDFEFIGKSVEFPGPPYRLSETPAQIHRPPRLGEHTAEVLASLRA